MPDRRQVLRALLLGAAGLAVPAACGLPSGGAAVVDGPGQPLGPGAGDTNRKAPTPADANDAQSLVLGFFGAVAGRLQVDGDVTQAGERAAAFLTSGFRPKWSPGNQITVVRRLALVGRGTGGDKPGSAIVDINVLPVGVLKSNGRVDPTSTAGPASVQLRFTVVPNTEAGRPGLYLIDNIEYVGGNGGLSGMMLDAANLDFVLYAPQLIYFWSTDKQRSGLVPDLRYVPRVGVSSEIQLTEIVKWVLGGLGPNDMLTNAVLGNQYTGNDLVVPLLTAPDSEGLLINLTIPPPQSLGDEQAMAQLRWSLRPFYTGTVRLEVNSAPQQVNGTSTDFRHRNLAESPFYDGDQTEFCVANGVVRPVNDPTNLPDVLSDLTAVNKDVRYAALSRDRSHAALVKTDNRLYLVGPPGNNKTATPVQLSGQPWTRPAFLPSNDPRVLVVVDGQLYLVQSGGAVTRLDGIGQRLTAFSVAPDGHRVALVAEEGVYVCSLKINGDGIAFGSPRQIDPGLTECTGIAWSRLDRVLVAGLVPGTSPAQYTVSEVTIDGAIANAWQPFVTRILSVVAQPQQPWVASGAGAAMVYTANGQASEVFSNHNSALAFPTSSQPSPSASPSGTAVGYGTPTYPFYVD
jgi:Lipoprotein LpqB beta-propeller domain